MKLYISTKKKKRRNEKFHIKEMPSSLRLKYPDTPPVMRETRLVQARFRVDGKEHD